MRGRHRRIVTVLLLTAGGGCAEVGSAVWAARASELDRAPSLMREYGCHGCHEIPGVRGARGRVGPSLAGVADRAYLGGVSVNSPENLARWIQAPSMFSPRTAMPDVGVTDEDARIIAAYLSTTERRR